MAGIIDVSNQKRGNAVGQLGYLSGLETQRDSTNKQINAQNKQQRNQKIGAGIGGATTMLMATGPVGMAAGGLMLLGSLF